MAVAASVVPADAAPTPALHCAPGIWAQPPGRAILPSPREPHNLSKFEWTDAISGALPYLDAGDMRRALRMFDCAMINLQQAKDVKHLLDACTKNDANSAPNPLEAMLSNLHRDRQLLFQEFQQFVEKKLTNVCGLQGHSTEGSQVAKRTPCSNTEFSLQVRCGEEHIKPPAKFTVDLACEKVAALIPSAREGAAAGHPPQFEAFPNQDFVPPDAVSILDSKTKSQCHGKQVQSTYTPNYNANQKISTILTTLSSKDPKHLFIVRRICQLGYKAERILKTHFARYGGVVRVFIAHSTARDKNAPHSESRGRQGSLGFVQMDSAKAVEQILAFGVEHKVKDVLIRVQRFQSHQHAMFEDGFLTI